MENSLNLGKKRVILLLSGGIDSATILGMLKKQDAEIHAVSFSYGQRHSVELNAVKNIVLKYPVHSHRVIHIDLRAFGGSALTADISVPKSDHFTGETYDVPVTYVPARNTIFLSFALALAETTGVYDIFMGANKMDQNNYPDCRPEFIRAFEKVANLATASGALKKGQFKIYTPLIEMTKAEVIRTGLSLGLDYSLTMSCYDPSPIGLSCGRCDACHFRHQGFLLNQVDDPTLYSV